MPYYPINLNLNDRCCIVIGGGRVAERKVAGLLEYGARVSVVSPELTESLAVLQRQRRIEWIRRVYRQGDLLGAFLVIAATDDREVQELIQQEAAERNILLNVVDVPERCSFILPATVRRGDLTISISTAGNSPALARNLRLELENRFGTEYNILVAILGLVRPKVLAAGLPQPENEAIFNRMLDPAMTGWIREKAWGILEEHLAVVLGTIFDPQLKREIREVYPEKARQDTER